MPLNRDLQSKPLLHLKGFLFMVIGLLASGILLFQSPTVKTVLLLITAIWAFCRFYYYLFYVLEKYIGRNQKYAGIFDALNYAIRSAFTRT